jgi:hypothetical protein
VTESFRAPACLIEEVLGSIPAPATGEAQRIYSNICTTPKQTQKCCKDEEEPLESTKYLQAVSKEKGGGPGKVANVCNMSRTVAIEVCLKFEHALFEKNSYFLFRL